MASAWATANHRVLGQVKVDDKSNEITAIPKLLLFALNDFLTGQGFPAVLWFIQWLLSRLLEP